MTQRRTEPRNVSLYPSDWKIIDEADTGEAGTSATLRRIVREWHREIAVVPQPGLHKVLDRLVDTRAPYATGSNDDTPV